MVKSVINLGQEYNLPKPTIYSWVKNYNNSGSFKAKDMEWQHFLGHFLYRHLFSKSNWR
ncbi:hypothetical protein [Spiroplasma endosymbiont of Poecilobothrus nobilitatus]|uniref:hypothetical protein n=1 Tax=Spiroplasma endosymbiont of Poecilobothrus nobilitatus TaxID=1209220 RepID=UPI00313F1DF6